MKRKSNWLKNLLQWGTLAAIVGFVVYGLTLGEKPGGRGGLLPVRRTAGTGKLPGQQLAGMHDVHDADHGGRHARRGSDPFQQTLLRLPMPAGNRQRMDGPGRQKTEGQRRNPPGKHRRPPAPRRQIRAAVLRVLHVGVKQRTFLQEFRPLLRRRHGLQG